jgi:hypothetical protein
MSDMYRYHRPQVSLTEALVGLGEALVAYFAVRPPCPDDVQTALLLTLPRWAARSGKRPSTSSIASHYWPISTTCQEGRRSGWLPASRRPGACLRWATCLSPVSTTARTS